MGLLRRLFGKRPSGKTVQRMEQDIERLLREEARKRDGGKS